MITKGESRFQGRFQAEVGSIGLQDRAVYLNKVGRMREEIATKTRVGDY